MESPGEDVGVRSCHNGSLAGLPGCAPGRWLCPSSWATAVCSCKFRKFLRQKEEEKTRGRKCEAEQVGDIWEGPAILLCFGGAVFMGGRLIKDDRRVKDSLHPEI